MTDPPTRSSVRADTEPTPTSAAASTVIPPPSFWARGWVGLAVQYPRGWWRLVLHSRFAAWLPFVVTGLGYAYAAAPDFGVEALRGPAGLAGLLALWLLSNLTTQLVLGVELRKHHRALQSMGDIISRLADHDAHRKGEAGEAQAAIVLLLRRAQELASATLRPPPGCEIGAHLLLPEYGRRRGGYSRVIGLWATYHDDYRPDRELGPVSLDAAGIGEAFSTGKATAIADTWAWLNPAEVPPPYRCLAAFPVTVGAGRRRRVAAVLTLDALTPYVFTPRNLEDVMPFGHPIAQLIPNPVKE